MDTSCISVKQNLFKQIMTGDKIFPNSSSCVEFVGLYTVGFCDQASSWYSSSGWTKELCS